MVHVEVEKEEIVVFQPQLVVFQGESLVDGKSSPCADSHTGRIPTQTGLFGRFAEPEIALVEQLHMVFFIENGGIFALRHAVVASHADAVVAVEPFEHVNQLFVEHLLRPENVGFHEVHLVANHLTALLPKVTASLVTPVFVANVIRTHEHRLCRRRRKLEPHCESHQQCRKKSILSHFHFSYLLTSYF